MSKAIQFQQMLPGLGEVYNKEVNEGTVRIYTKVFEKSVGFDHDWGEIFTELTLHEKFWPSPAVILEYVKKSSGLMTGRELAEAFVDEVLMAIGSAGNVYETLGKEKYDIMKKQLGIIPMDIRAGMIKPQYMRSQWIESATRYFDEQNKEMPLGLSGKEKFTLLSGEKNDKIK